MERSSGPDDSYVVGWSACYLEGCGYGMPYAPAWFVWDLPDSFGVYDLRVGTQVIGMAWAIIVGGLVWISRQWHISVWGRFWGMWLLLALGYASMTYWRGDTAILLTGWRLDTLLWLAIALVSLVGIGWSWQRKQAI